MKELDDLVKKVNDLEDKNVRLTNRLHKAIVMLTAVHSHIMVNKGICSLENLEKIERIINGDK